MPDVRRHRWTPPWRRGGHVLGINARNLLYVHGLNPRRHFPLADDKVMTKTTLLSAGIPMPATLTVLSNVSDVMQARGLLAEAVDFVLKPARGRRGDGILVITESRADRFVRSDGVVLSWEDLRRAMGDILFGVYSYGRDDRVLVERRIKAHRDLMILAGEGLPDIRVILLNGEPVMAMMRVPTHASGGRANLHQGALGVGLRLSDGMAMRCIHEGRPVDIHPDHQASMIGFVIPCWPQVIEVARRAAATLPLPYLGVDVVLTDDEGPLIMEVNVRPGLEIQNVNGRGLRDALEKASERS